MTYRREQLLRALALAGMATFIIGEKSSWSYGVLGLMIWVTLLPFTGSRFVAGFIPTDLDLRRLWPPTRPRKRRVPRLAIDFAKRLKARPPKAMKIEPVSEFNAAVDRDTLSVTEGLRAGLWTRAAEGVIAHEMAHLAGKHVLKKNIVSCLIFCLIAVTVVLIGKDFWGMPIVVSLTILPVFYPLLSRHLEYDADERAAAVVGTDTMSHALRTIADRPRWGENSDTHPSIESRLARLRRRENRDSN